MGKTYCTAIVLAAGKGTRMGTRVQKQYLLLEEKPILYYSLRTFQKSALIDEIILVTGAEEVECCRKKIINAYNFTKVKKIVPGGKERYHSVWNGLQAIEEKRVPNSYVFIHDGARPFVTQEIIARAYGQVVECRACVVGMPVKDTIKIADDAGNVADTPDRKRLWMIQTPQVFETELVRRAYQKIMCTKDVQVTDDAMVVEKMERVAVKLVQGAYENIKITTPEDLEIGKTFVQHFSN